MKENKSTWYYCDEERILSQDLSKQMIIDSLTDNNKVFKVENGVYIVVHEFFGALFTKWIVKGTAGLDRIGLLPK